LPLEQLVAEKLSDKGFIVGGEFSYSRLNTEGNLVDFSVDLHASLYSQVRKEVPIFSDLELLIECKYSSPEVDCFFASYPNLEPLTANSVHTYDHLSKYWIGNKTPFKEIEKDAKYVVNGIAISESFVDNKRIKHGLNQLRHAIPSLLEKIAELALMSDDENLILLISPILVTNAKLRALNTASSYEDIRNANSLEDISETYDVVYQYQTSSHELQHTVRSKTEYIVDNLDDGKRNVSFSANNLSNELNDSLESIAIVNLEYLDEYLGILANAASSFEASTPSEIAYKFKKFKKFAKKG
jgi:hypothetical protein